MRIPKTVYKYTSLPVAEMIIGGQSLKFANPKTFNDPFDCDISGIFFDLNGHLDFIVKNEINQLKELFKPNSLSIGDLEEAYKQSITGKLNNSVITCFSSEKNNHLLWAHYAVNHTGMCLGFDQTLPKNERFLDIKLEMEGSVSYGYNGKLNFCANKILGHYRLYFTKLKFWRYEKEIRYIALGDEGIYHFNKNFLKTITFGLRVSDYEIGRIIRLCERMKFESLSFFKARIDGSKIVCDVVNK